MLPGVEEEEDEDDDDDDGRFSRTIVVVVVVVVVRGRRSWPGARRTGSSANTPPLSNKVVVMPTLVEEVGILLPIGASRLHRRWLNNTREDRRRLLRSQATESTATIPRNPTRNPS